MKEIAVGTAVSTGPGVAKGTLEVGAYPDGTPIAVGDSVLITIRLVDPRRLEVELLPAGLRFNPQEPAQLSFDFGFAEEDLDDDGDVDDRDQALSRQLAVWRLPGGAAAWTKLARHTEHAPSAAATTP